VILKNDRVFKCETGTSVLTGYTDHYQDIYGNENGVFSITTEGRATMTNPGVTGIATQKYKIVISSDTVIDWIGAP